MQITPPPSRNIGPHREGEVLVKLRAQTRLLGATAQDNFEDDYGMDVMETIPMPHSAQRSMVGSGPVNEVLRLKLPEGISTEQALEQLAQDERVEYAAPNTIYQRDATPNDLGKELYAMRKIQAPEAWNLTTGARNGPVVAVLDDGVDIRHPDLAANIWTNPKEIPDNNLDDDGNGVVDDVHGFNAAKNTGDPRTNDSHGTHCAGTIGAVGNNGQGVVGVNWQAQILPVQIFGPWGADAATIAKALSYAASMGARIASCSFGGGVFNPVVYEAFQKSPMLHICAAGNHAKDVEQFPHYPASFDLPNIVSVAATDENDRLARYSNYGKVSADLAAPGSAILSTVTDGKYEEMSGTSMATPHVSGVATLIATLYPTATNDQIRTRLLANTDPIPELKDKVTTGGRLNALKALENDTAAPSEPGGLRANANGPLQVQLSWKAPGDDGLRGNASFYEARYSETPITSFEQGNRLPMAPPKSSGAQESATIPLMPSSQPRTLYTALKALDNVGNESPTVQAQCQVPAAKLALEAAGGSDLWEGEGSWGVTELPDKGKVWTDSPQGEYTHRSNLSLTSKPFSLKGSRSSKLIFESRFSVEREKDALWIEGSSDGGKTWKPVSRLQGDGAWGIREVDLSSLDNKDNVRVRLRLQTDETGARDGIYLGKAAITA